MQILLANAYEAWKNTIYYHDRIEDGFTTLIFQKGFVSSLHNSVELFLKQIMLNNNDHEVAKLRKPDKKLQDDYCKSGNLNEFFKKLSPNQLNKFFTVEYSKLITKSIELLEIEDSGEIEKALKLLGKLRNAETHFYINDNNYLSESDFVKLHNFMIKFFHSIANKCLLPNCMIDFEKPEFHYKLIQQDEIMDFNRQPLDSLSYIEVLKRNKTVENIKNTIHTLRDHEYHCCEDEYYIAQSICSYDSDLYRNSFSDVYTLLQLISKYKLFEITL